MLRSNSDQLHRVKMIRNYLPIILFVIVASYESWEHLLLTGNFKLDFHGTSEVLFFGVIGPTSVFFVLSYVVSLLEKQMIAAGELEALNITLEQKVEVRTKALAERNAELAAANEELQKLDELKSDFVSLVSHELRGPLTTLNGGIELALQDGESMSPESRRTLVVMARESERLTEFVQTILDVSRLDAGKWSLNLGAVAVTPLIKHVIQLLNADRHRDVDFDEQRGLPPVWVDETALEKIICNLMTNADKYSPSGKPIELTANLKHRHLEITVTDYGAGIPTAMQSRIFERFQRLESGDRITTKGWGLGLYFAKALAEAQGCTLSVRSPAHEDGEYPGSTFILTVPLANEIPADA